MHLPGELRAHGDNAPLMVSATSVRAALEQLAQSHPSLYRGVCHENGVVRPHINVFVNTTHMRERQGLDTALVSGDVIWILPAVSGG